MEYDYSLFATRPSRVVSLVCYSVFRIEVYRGCRYGCIYCYSRWYRASAPIINAYTYLTLWKRLAYALSTVADTGAPIPYFRLSTLTEPLQEGVEDRYMLSLEAMRAAYMSGVPIILSTRSTLAARTPWLDVVQEMSGEKLLLVQYSLPIIDENTAARLEPGAPPPSRRIEAMEKLREHGATIVLRLQPLIPGLEHQHIEAVRELRGLYSGVITEPLRATIEDIDTIARVLGYTRERYMEKYGWRPYTSRSANLYTPGPAWYREVLEQVRRYAATPVSPCKSPPLTPVQDCCMFWLTGNTRYGVRETIRELLLPRLEHRARVIKPEKYRLYPAPVRRALRLHYNKLVRTIRELPGDPLLAENILGAVPGREA